MRINGGLASLIMLGTFGLPAQSSLICSVGDDGDDDEGGDDGEPDAKFVRMFNKLFHKASSERDKRTEKRLMEQFDKSLGEKLEDLRSALIDTADDDEPKGGSGDGTKSGASPEMEARFRQMEKELKENKERAEKWEKSANEEKERNKRNEEIGQLTSMLNGSVKPALLEMIVEKLHSKNLTRDPESGTLLWKGQDGELLPLKDGIDSWKKSDMGKEVAPPKEVRGSGGSGGGAGGIVKPGEMTMDILGGIVSQSTGSR